MAYSFWLIVEVAGFDLCAYIMFLVILYLRDHVFAIMYYNLQAIKTWR